MRTYSLSLWRNTTSLWKTPLIYCWASTWTMHCLPSWSRCSQRCPALLLMTEYPTAMVITLKHSQRWSRNSIRIGTLTRTHCLLPYPSPRPPPTDLTLHLTGLLRWIRRPTGGRLLLVLSGGKYPHLPLTITHGRLSSKLACLALSLTRLVWPIWQAG